MQNKEKGKISAFLTIEEGATLRGDISNLRNFHRLGVKLITLTWNFPNEIGYPNVMPEHQVKGLAPFGFQVIDEMNNLNMIIDVSHLSDGGFYDVARYSRAPFVASHSNARAITNNPRNLDDNMIRLLASKGGVMGINFYGHFLGGDEFSRIDDMIRHIKHIKKVGGIDVLSLGSDFDGIDSTLEIENIGEIHKLIYALQKNNFTDDEIDKILYKNTLRVLKEIG
jgi:membrane dipeptidase